MTEPAEVLMPLRLSRLQLLVRILGGFLLTLAALMVVLGVTVLADALHGPRFALYWSWCFLCAMGTIVVAGWDLVLLRRAYHRHRRELFERQFRASITAAELKQGGRST